MKTTDGLRTLAPLPIMFPDIASLVPHRPPLLLLDALEDIQGNRMRARFTVRADNIFLRDDGTLEDVALLEAMAQSFAAGCGLHVPNQPGYLAGVRHCRVTGVARLGDVLCASASVMAQVGDIVVVEGSLARGEEILATAEFKIHAPGAPRLVP